MVRVGLCVIAAVLSATGAAADRWDGPRLGVRGGVAVVDASYDFFRRDALVGQITEAVEAGAALGAAAGYDIAFGDATLGVAASLDYMAVEQSRTIPVGRGTLSAETKFALSGTLGPRVGTAIGDTYVYGEGGVAAAYIDQRIETAVGMIDDASGHLGWTVAAGVERPITENLSIAAEVRFTDLSTFTFEARRLRADTSATFATATVGVTWRW